MNLWPQSGGKSAPNAGKHKTMDLYITKTEEGQNFILFPQTQVSTILCVRNPGFLDFGV